MSFAHPWLLALLVLPPAALAGWWLGWARGRARTARLSRVPAAAPPYLAAVLLTLAGCAAIVAAAGPRWGTRESVIPREGAQLVFVLDVSRSMAARDVAPSRLEAAKAAMVATINRLGGDRVGLVIFGGDARLRFPLTTDFTAATNVIRTLDVGPIFVEGGTNASSGLQIALDTFDAGSSAGRLIVLITDGDDLGEDPAVAAQRVKASGADLIVAGAGTPEGATIPVFDTTQRKEIAKLGADGQPIVTKLNETFLRAVAVASGGRYAGSNLAALPGAIEGRIASLQRASFERQSARLPVERHQWFTLAALVLVGLATVVGKVRLPGRQALVRLGVVAGAALLLASCATRANDLNEQGRAAYSAKDYTRAVTLFTQAQVEEPANADISLNLAAALTANGQYDEATRAARRALASRDAAVRARAQASIGHQRFAVGDLPGALEAFRQALIEAPGDTNSRHDYEVVLRLLTPEADQTPDQGNGASPSASPTGTPPATTPQPGDGGTGATPQATQDGQGQGQGQQPGDQQPGQGQQPGTTQTPPPNQPGGPSNQPGQPGPNSGPPGGGGTVRSSQEADQRVNEIDRQIGDILQQSGDDPTPEQANQILDLLAERARIASLRDAFFGGGNPRDY